MSNYFYHPLGDDAENYISGSASTGALPHTYSSHGFSKIDFGVGKTGLFRSAVKGRADAFMNYPTIY